MPREKPAGIKGRRITQKEADGALKKAIQRMSTFGVLSKSDYADIPLVKTKEVHSKDPYANPKDRLGINKVPFHLIPQSALVHEAMAMWQGGVKYGPYNWRDKKVVASIYTAAGMRHFSLFWEGEDFAADGFHHLGHVRACTAIILDAEATGNLIDDRPPKGATGALIAAYNDMLAACNAWMDASEGKTGLERMAAVDWKKAQQIYYDKLKEERGA